jgi:glycosyltransferase involved in cell wall biosynthesis
MVGLEELPWELARFDINLAPLEVDNPYCEAKSELKFFEAALVIVPTIASPTHPFKSAIRDGQNGFLASTQGEWLDRMMTLHDDLQLREKLGQAAWHDVQGPYGVATRATVVADLVQKLTAP